MKSALRFLFYSVWSVVMTALTYVLGAASLKVLRRRYGRLIYWSATTLISVGLFAAGLNSSPALKVLAVAFFSLVVLVGTLSELEELGLSFMVSGFFTLVINALLAAGAFALWVSSTGPKWNGLVLTYVENWLKPLSQINPNIQINYYDLMLQLPSIALILWMGAIYVAVLLEPRLSEAAEPSAHPLRAQLREVRLPDAIIWLFILSLLGAFGGLQVKAVEALAVNVLNVCLVLFFFQGIAVVAKFFESLRMGAFWQFVFMVLVVVHLFLFVSVLGLVDYWMDFRARLSKRREEFNREA